MRMKQWLSLLLTACLLLGCAAAAETAPFSYEHDPRENPGAMRDIVENPAAVYGFSPNPDSARLGSYADALDWTDPDQVAEARAQRQAYHDSLSELYRMIEEMLLQAQPVEDIARAVSQRRNELRLAAYGEDPEQLALVKKSNLETYGNEMGPTPDQLYEKYGSWQTVLEKALGTNAGMDACLGFYDEFFELYGIEEAEAVPEAAAPGAADAEAPSHWTDIQYVLYLGTNDKDTNKPVFTQAEALEKAKEILLRHFGGYTIQEASGGWIDGETAYQEYTLVIYLSDTDEAQVHAAANELIETFNQSSVMIQANPTRTEFYSGK